VIKAAKPTAEKGSFPSVNPCNLFDLSGDYCKLQSGVPFYIYLIMFNPAHGMTDGHQAFGPMYVR